MPQKSGRRDEWVILGSGTSTGVPLLQCRCATCRSKHPRNQRLRVSAWVRSRGRSLLIDTATDLRQQALRARIPRVDAVLYTHPHADHVSGVDEIRAFNFVQKQVIPAFGNAWTQEELVGRFPYVFQRASQIVGGGRPELDFHLIDGQVSSFNAAGIEVIPISTQHGPKECLGYRINSVAYVTDCHYIPPESLDRLRGLKVLILDCLRVQPHDTHLTLDRALEVISELRPSRTYLTHLGHDFEYRRWSKKLPKGVALAHDGLRFRI
ncbi:MAG: MBL fold metallo-hydrolase [Bdellovibrionales bacterium]|nr:MBL fold metallo-hydrolase [Bdellovibrionales bacterium]